MLLNEVQVGFSKITKCVNNLFTYEYTLIVLLIFGYAGIQHIKNTSTIYYKLHTRI